MTEIIFISTNSTSSDLENDGSQEMLMSAAGYVAAAVTLFFIGIFGCILNICVIVLMCKDKQLWTPLNIILFNLVCSDFAVSILGTPWTFASAVSQRWIFGRMMCTGYGFFMSLFGIASITTLTVLAFERFLIVTHPFRSRGLTRRGAIYLVAGIWAYSLILTTPPLFGWGKYVNEAANISCSVNWEEQSKNAMTYILYLFFFGLVLPLIVIIYSYVQIIRTMKMSQIQMGQTSKAEGRVAYMILLMIVAFILAWSPYAVTALLVQFGEPSLVPPAAGVIPALLAKSSICYNPIIYVGLNSQFRQVIRQTLRIEDPADGSTCETYAMGVSRFMTQTIPNILENNRCIISNAVKHETKEQTFIFNDTARSDKITEVMINIDKDDKSDAE